MAARFADWAGFGTKSLQIFYDQSQIPQSLTPSATTGLHSNVLMSPVMWVMRAFTEAQLVVQSRRQDKGGGILWERVVDHEMETLIDRPNDFYDGDALWKGTALSYLISGNAYWRKVRNIFGDVIQLWYVPHWMIRPVWPSDGSTFVSHYSYSNGIGAPISLAPRDVVHFRFGLDPENPRLGYSPLQAVLREVVTDDEASSFSEKILENMGVPGMIVSPKGNYKPKETEVARLQTHFNQAFSGERRGMAMVMGGETEVSQFGFDPNKLMLPNLRDISEERVCSAIGIPAAVVGFGSGLQSTKVGATMRELVKLAWVQCVTPMQSGLGRQLTAQLLPDFQSQVRRFRARFDTTEVSAFQEEAKAEAERVTLLVEKNILRRDRAQQILGLEVDPSCANYWHELETEKAEVIAEATPAPAPHPIEDAPDDVVSDDDTKMLRAIAARLPKAVTSNGNGNHSHRA
jgi:HK97 family phage portal protein